MADEIEVLTAELREIIRTPLSQENIDRFDAFAVIHFFKGSDVQESKILHCLVSTMSLVTILQRATQTESTRVYLVITSRLAKLPEFSGEILQRTEIWRMVRELAQDMEYKPHMYSLYLNSSISLIVATMVNSQSKYFKFVKQGMLFESLIMLVNKSPEKLVHEHKSLVETAVQCLLINNKMNKEVIEYLQNSGIMENLELLNGRQDLHTILISPELPSSLFNKVKDNITRSRDIARERYGPLLCNSCQKEESGKKFKYCRRCKSVYYCSRKCQKKAWKTHKKYCKVLRVDHESEI